MRRDKGLALGETHLGTLADKRQGESLLRFVSTALLLPTAPSLLDGLHIAWTGPQYEASPETVSELRIEHRSSDPMTT